MTALTDRKNLTLYVLIAMALGIAFGIFFGEYSKILEPVGSIYIMMLQSVVYPYLISSLIFGLGSMDKTMALKFFKKGWVIYVGLIGVSICVIYTLLIDIPKPQSHIITENTLSTLKQFLDNVLQNIIPANPFKAIVENAIPAVVLISILYGLALQRLKSKSSHLSLFESIMQASIKIWNWMIYIAPIGVFAMLANFSGTIQLSDIKGVGIFLSLFFAGSLFLTLLILPTLISAFTPLNVRDVLRNLQNALLISLVTTLPSIAVPFIAAATRSILKKHGPKIAEKKEEEIINPALSISYPLCQLGNMFLLLFVFFSLFFFNRPISFNQQISLPILNYFASIGSPSASVNGIQFLASSMNLPKETTELYVALIPLTRYPQVLVSVMGMAFFTILFSLHYFNRIKIRWNRLFLCLFYLILFFCAAFAFKGIAFRLLKSQQPNLMSFTIDPSLTTQTKVTVYRSIQEAEDFLQKNKSGATTLTDIQKRGYLTVGYHADRIPWCYFNNNNELVGYDVGNMYKLANDLGVNLVFLPYRSGALTEDIITNTFDIGIGSIYVSSERLEKVAFTNPYFTSISSLIVKNEEAKYFNSVDDILKIKNIKIASLKDSITQHIAKLNFPQSAIVLVDNYNTLQENNGIDAALWIQVSTEAWVTIHPGYASIVPQGMISDWPLLLAYMVNKESIGLLSFLNYWFKLEEIEDFTNKQYNHWILRTPENENQSRWSIIRNVLHWVSEKENENSHYRPTQRSSRLPDP